MANVIHTRPADALLQTAFHTDDNSATASQGGAQQICTPASDTRSTTSGMIPATVPLASRRISFEFAGQKAPRRCGGRQTVANVLPSSGRAVGQNARRRNLGSSRRGAHDTLLWSQHDYNGTDPLPAGLLLVERLNVLARRCGNPYNRDGPQLLGMPAMSSAASVAHRGG